MQSKTDYIFKYLLVGFWYQKSMKIDKKSIKTNQKMEVEAKKCQDRPKKATKRGKRRNKRAMPTLGPTGPWPGGRGVQLNDQKLGI